MDPASLNQARLYELLDVAQELSSNVECLKNDFAIFSQLATRLNTIVGSISAFLEAHDATLDSLPQVAKTEAFAQLMSDVHTRTLRGESTAVILANVGPALQTMFGGSASLEWYGLPPGYTSAKRTARLDVGKFANEYHSWSGVLPSNAIQSSYQQNVLSKMFAPKWLFHLVQPLTLPVVQPAPPPVVESVTEFVSEPLPVQPTQKPVAEPVVESVSEPVPVQPAPVQPTQESVVESAAQPTQKPVAESVSEPPVQATQELASEPAPKPVAEPVSEPALQPVNLGKLLKDLSFERALIESQVLLRVLQLHTRPECLLCERLWSILKLNDCGKFKAKTDFVRSVVQDLAVCVQDQGQRRNICVFVWKLSTGEEHALRWDVQSHVWYHRSTLQDEWVEYPPTAPSDKKRPMVEGSDEGERKKKHKI